MDIYNANKLFRKINKIQGWFSFESAMFFAMIDEIQKQNNVQGDIFEIGVHHGRSTLFLAGLLNNNSENLQVCDLFRKQDLNLSGSGKGNKLIFENNLKRLFPQNKIVVHEKLSTNLTIDEIGKKYRIFHIDGGHSMQETLSDMELAASSTIDLGIIVIDDPMTYVWPGVIHGIFEFLFKHKDYTAVIAGFNKMVIVKKEFADIYAVNFDNLMMMSQYEIGYPYQYKKLPFLDSELRIIFLPSKVDIKSLKTQLIKYIKKNNLRDSQTFLKTLYRFKKTKSNIITEDFTSEKSDNHPD